jgi:hypothetical protein
VARAEDVLEDDAAAFDLEREHDQGHVAEAAAGVVAIDDGAGCLAALARDAREFVHLHAPQHGQPEAHLDLPNAPIAVVAMRVGVVLLRERAAGQPAPEALFEEASGRARNPWRATYLQAAARATDRGRDRKCRSGLQWPEPRIPDEEPS